MLGGKVSTGANATNDVESFIDNISLEYRLDQSGTRYIRLFHNKNYESVLKVKLLRPVSVHSCSARKWTCLSELFIFKRKRNEDEKSKAICGQRIRLPFIGILIYSYWHIIVWLFITNICRR